jgi:hypothetical protein
MAFIMYKRTLCRTEEGNIPFTSEVLCDDGDESLEGTKDSSVNHDWSFELRCTVGIATLVGSSVSQVESLGDIEIELQVSLML